MNFPWEHVVRLTCLSFPESFVTLAAVAPSSRPLSYGVQRAKECKGARVVYSGEEGKSVLAADKLGRPGASVGTEVGPHQSTLAAIRVSDLGA